MRRSLIAKFLPIGPVHFCLRFLPPIGIIGEAEQFKELGEVLLKVRFYSEKIATVWPDRFLISPSFCRRSFEVESMQVVYKLIELPENA